ncbi:MAG TPA: VTT domain-containing protein [Bryobacteraceae bacterium]|jgi:membrane-associated protein|nr:VTT domain-containing protein [Bryobacteraceae bacterium]
MLQSVFEFFKSLYSPDKLIQLLGELLSSWPGYVALFGLVFAETGLLVGIVVPGDSMLFTVGVVVGAGHSNIVAVVALLVLAAIVGDSTGYLLGRQTGPRVFSRKDSLFFKQEYVVRTQAFYERYGGKTILFARFLPVVRSFAAFMAGVGRMPYLRFLPYSICGGFGSVLLLTMLGYELGGTPFVRHYFDKVILAIVFISLLPTLIEVVRARRKASN